MIRGRIMYCAAAVALVLSLVISGCVSPEVAPTPTPAPTATVTAATPAPSPAQVTAEIRGFRFVPETITVTKGTTVTWTNRDPQPHTVTTDAFDSGRLGEDGTFSYTFDQAGTFEYRCTIHPSIPHGKVIVTEEGTSVEVLEAPATAQAGKSFKVTWRVSSPVQKSIPHTAVHYGSESKSEPLTLQSYPSLTTPYSGSIPADFSFNITITNSGTTYFRAHAIIDGDDYWSPERTITITGAAMEATPAATTPAGYG